MDTKIKCRFMNKFTVNQETLCWEWNIYNTTNRKKPYYPMFWINGGQVRANRMSLGFAGGGGVGAAGGTLAALAVTNPKNVANVLRSLKRKGVLYPKKRIGVSKKLPNIKNQQNKIKDSVLEAILKSSFSQSIGGYKSPKENVETNIK